MESLTPKSVKGTRRSVELADPNALPTASETEQALRNRIRELETRQAEMERLLPATPDTAHIASTAEHYRRAIVDSPFPVMIHADDGQILLVNKAWTEVSGYTSADMPTTKEWLAKALRDQGGALRDRINKLYEQDARLDEGEFVVTTRSGEHRVWDMSSAPLGNIGGQRLVITMAKDVTDRTRAEEALRVSQRRLQQALTTGRMGYFDWDFVTGEVVWSDEVRRMLGLEADRLPPSPNLIVQLAPATDRSRLKRHLADVAQGKCPLNIEHSLILPSGEAMHVVAKGELVTDESGRPRRLLGTLLDISEVRRMEEQAAAQRQQLEQAAKMASVGVLAAGVAHEINNPNYLIMLNISLLRTVWDNIRPILDHYRTENGDFVLAGKPYSEMRDEVGDILSDILGGSERIKRIVQELRDFAREPAHSPTERVDVNAVVEKALVLLSNVVKKRTGRFEVTCAPVLPLVPGNAQRLEQVIINLVHNACQALPEPGCGIFVNTSCESDGKEVVVTVRDQGVGIAPDILSRITEPFFTTKRESGGMGLGLSVSSNIVREHHGRLEFSSDLGTGTTVRLILPAAPEQPTKE